MQTDRKYQSNVLKKEDEQKSYNALREHTSYASVESRVKQKYGLNLNSYLTKDNSNNNSYSSTPIDNKAKNFDYSPLLASQDKSIQPNNFKKNNTAANIILTKPTTNNHYIPKAYDNSSAKYISKPAYNSSIDEEQIHTSQSNRNVNSYQKRDDTNNLSNKNIPIKRKYQDLKQENKDRTTYNTYAQRYNYSSHNSKPRDSYDTTSPLNKSKKQESLEITTDPDYSNKTNKLNTSKDQTTSKYDISSIATTVPKTTRTEPSGVTYVKYNDYNNSKVNSTQYTKDTTTTALTTPPAYNTPVSTDYTRNTTPIVNYAIGFSTVNTDGKLVTVIEKKELDDQKNSIKTQEIEIKTKSTELKTKSESLKTNDFKYEKLNKEYLLVKEELESLETENNKKNHEIAELKIEMSQQKKEETKQKAQEIKHEKIQSSYEDKFQNFLALLDGAMTNLDSMKSAKKRNSAEKKENNKTLTPTLTKFTVKEPISNQKNIKAVDDKYSTLFENTNKQDSQHLQIAYGETNDKTDLDSLKECFLDMRERIGTIFESIQQNPLEEQKPDFDFSSRKDDSIVMDNYNHDNKQIHKSYSLNSKNRPSEHSKRKTINSKNDQSFPSIDFVSNVNTEKLANSSVLEDNQYKKYHDMYNDSKNIQQESFAEFNNPTFGNIHHEGGMQVKFGARLEKSETFADCRSLHSPAKLFGNNQILESEVPGICYDEQSLIPRPEQSLLVNLLENPDGKMKVIPEISLQKEKSRDNSRRRGGNTRQFFRSLSKTKEIDVISEDEIMWKDWMFKQSRWIKKWRKRWCVLTTTYQYSFESQNIKVRSTEKICLIDCVSIEDNVADCKEKNAFRINVASDNPNERTFLFYVDNEKSKEKWISIIKKIVGLKNN